ncbi:MAG: GNAT family N-acetyltransferase [Pseudomonadales bacterium]|nr:GNAT family N-acetyltransferase [Pseudomonadales bacterium]
MTNTAISAADIPAAHQVVKAHESDIKQVCDILGDAFSRDPVLNWITPKASIYSGLFRAGAEALYKKHNHVYINRNGTGAALWLPAGISPKSPFHWRLFSTLFSLVAASGIGGLKRASELEKVFADNHPQEPHFYLHAIGATQDCQGKGIGSALLKAGLAACDEQGMPAYLESTNPRNNPLYERYGFNIVGEATLSNGGPNVWFMRRNQVNQSP